MTNIDAENYLLSLFERTNLYSVTEFQKVLIKSLESILGKINRYPSGSWSSQRLNKIKSEIIKLIDDDYQELLDLINVDKKEWARLAYDANIDTFATAGVVATSFTKLPESAITRILDDNVLIMGRTLKENVQALAGTNKNIIPEMINGLSVGAPNDDIAKVIRERYGSLERHKVDALVRQVVSGSMTLASDEAIAQINKVSNVVNRAFFSSVLDESTTPYCGSMNGVTWHRKPEESYQQFQTRVYTPSKKNHNIPPRVPCCVHWGCRSKLLFTTAEFVNEYNKGTKQAVIHDTRTVNHRDGTTSTKKTVSDVQEIPIKKSWSQWFDENLPDKQKERYLGKTNFELYKSGNLSVKDLVSIRGNRVLTVQEVKAKMK